MEKAAYPILDQPKDLPQMQPKAVFKPVVKQQVPIVETQNLELKINWAQIFNILVLVGVILLGLAYDSHLSDVTNMPIFRPMLWFKYILIILNIVHYFSPGNDIVNQGLTIFAYTSFVELIVNVLILLVVLSQDVAYILAAGLGLVFITLPTFLVGLTSWILLKNSITYQSANQIYTMAQSFYQEQTKEEQAQPKYQQVQFIVQP
uniref:Transmembrane protein n=1 Tax=Euplotes crassus TaxID=5936 RepID=A0A7S3KHC0_EUPCR|mmetsp:Transcript_24115/g.24038  ORF Transcript_24115/g.24038 Transcript_24115/m.24038 type:complete len:205 (+) Transcript_24115:23-637(+)